MAAASCIFCAKRYGRNLHACTRRSDPTRCAVQVLPWPVGIPIRFNEAVVQTKAERRENDAIQGCHWTISLLKRWLLGIHAGAVRDKHLQAHLDEFAFRHNRRKTKGVGRIAARVIESLVTRPPMPMRKLIDDTRRCRWFASNQSAPA